MTETPAQKPILHTGNILNNSYLHSKFLRKVGVKADCLNLGYDHCQGQPEWVEVDLDPTISVPEWSPDWRQIDVNGFQRPDWYLEMMLEDLEAYTPDMRPVPLYLRKPSVAAAPVRRVIPKSVLRSFYRGARDSSRNLLSNIGLAGAGKWITEGDSFLKDTLFHIQNLRARSRFRSMTGHSAEFVSRFAEAFPDAEHRLTENELRYEVFNSLPYRRIFPYYRLVQAYALEPNRILLADPEMPFIAYEHGTLRDFPYENSVRGKLYSLAVKSAERVIITNADCKSSADRLGLDNTVFLPHLIDDETFCPGETALSEELRKEHDCDLVIVAPARHHWKHSPPGLENSLFKRNDIMIKALGQVFRERPNIRAVVVFFDWGQEVELSKALIEECGFPDRVRWEPIRTKKSLSHFIRAADIVLDQFNDGIGTFGALAPEGMACAKPVVLNYKEELHHWCYPTLPPLINARDEDALKNVLFRLVDDDAYRRNVGEAGLNWFQEYHSSKFVISRLIEIYQEIFDEHGWPVDELFS